MSQNTREPQIIELVKIRQWYVPADSSSYEILRGLKIPRLKIHRDMLPIIKMATGPRGIRARAKDFTEILNARLDKMGTQWQSRKGRKCRMTDKRLVFVAPSTEHNKKATAALEASFAKFCLRWGFKYVPNYSEKDGRLKLVVDYEFDPERNPVISDADKTEVSEFEVVLGFTKIRLTFNSQLKAARGMPPVTHLEVFEQAGTMWKPVHTGTFADQQIGALEPLMTALSSLYDRRKVHD